MAPDDAAPLPATTRFLVVTIIVSIALHALALATMALVIQPGLAVDQPVAERASVIATSPWLWRLGWLPWQLTAASDVAVSIALVIDRQRRPGAVWAWACLPLTLAAVTADQWGETVLVTSFVDAARALGPAPDAAAAAAYVELEAWTLFMTGTCANGTYTLMSIGWLGATITACGGLARNRWLLGLGAIDLALFTGCSVTNWWVTTGATVEGGYPGFAVMTVFNALAFPLLCVWMGLMARAFLARRQMNPDPGNSHSA